MLTNFKRLMAARFFYNFAVTMQAILIGWQMYTLTHDPLYLGFVGLTEAVPALSLALFAGYIVDRSRALIVYRAVVAGSLLSGIVLLVSQSITLTEHQQVWGLFVASFITGVARGFSQPAMYAIVPRIVPRERLQQASAWMTSAMQIARISGPAAGGIVFGFSGVRFAAWIVCITLTIALLSVVAIGTRLTPRTQRATTKSIKHELLLGLRFVFGHPILLPALSLDMISVLFGGVTALLPVFASDVLNIGPKGLGLLRAAPAVGAAFASLALTRIHIRHTAGRWLFSAVAGFGLCILVFGLSHNLVLSMLALALSGAFDSASMVIRSSTVQLVSPDHMRGRISAVNSIFIGSSNELGEFESGVAARFLGTVPSVIFGAGMCLLTVVAVAVFSPPLRRLDLDKLKQES